MGLEMAQLLKALSTLPQRPKREEQEMRLSHYLEASRESIFYSQNLHIVLSLQSYVTPVLVDAIPSSGLQG